MISTYAYARVSDKSQNLDRQLSAIKNYRPEIQECNIFTDKETGKTFDRKNYSALKIIIEHIVKAKREDDVIELVVEELDRLGRNAEGIKKELEWFKQKGVCVRILEIPTTLIDITTENKWVMDLINQILIDVYASMAQQELEKRAKRQREGIEEAHKRGVQFGRKPIEVDLNIFEKNYKDWKNGKITAVQAMKNLNLKSNTFYRRVAVYEKNGVK